MHSNLNHGETILSLWEELENMPEHQTIEEIKHFRISIEIFNGNYTELLHYLKIHNDPDTHFQMMSVEKRNLLFAFQKEITRYLHNYVASALSLTDHARNHYRELYLKNNLFPDYQEKIDEEFKNNPLPNFIKDLRQYFQHYKMPIVSSHVSFQYPSNLDISLVMPIKELLKYSNWKSQSKKFLDAQKDDINLITLINEYYDLIKKFYTWFLERQYEIHKNDFLKVEKHIAKIRNLEISQIILQLTRTPMKMKDFEFHLFRIFPEEKLGVIKNSITLAERVLNILQLLKEVKNLSEQELEQINKIYKSP